MRIATTFHCANCLADFGEAFAFYVDVGGVPPEYEARCPDCGSSALDEREEIIEE